jgi:hypothetical protein
MISPAATAPLEIFEVGGQGSDQILLIGQFHGE